MAAGAEWHPAVLYECRDEEYNVAPELPLMDAL